jgi:hypothetical protein
MSFSRSKRLTGLSHFGVATDFAVLSVLTVAFLLGGS